MSHVSWESSVRDTPTRSRPRPARALTGRYHRSSSINLVQGLLAKLSIAEMYHTLTPTYPDTILETVFESQQDDDQLSTEPNSQPLSEQPTPASLTTLIEDKAYFSPVLAEEPTSRAVSPIPSLRSDSLQIRKGASSPSSTTTTTTATSTQDTCLSLEGTCLNTGNNCPPPPFEIIPDRLQSPTRTSSTRSRKRDFFKRISRRQSLVYGTPQDSMQMEKVMRRSSFIF